MEWSVEIDYLGDGEVDPETIIEALEALDPIAPASSYERGRYSFRVSVDSPTSETAFKLAKSAITNAIKAAGLPDWTLVRGEVISGDELDRVLAVRDYPELLGVAELAELLGVSRQRASALATQSNFPSPIAQLTATPVWDKATIGNFLKEWKRTPGRPSTKHNDNARQPKPKPLAKRGVVLGEGSHPTVPPKV